MSCVSGVLLGYLRLSIVRKRFKIFNKILVQARR